MDTSTKIELFPEQQAAKDLFLDWFESEVSYTHPIFRIFGFAGTGKTTITREIIREVKGSVLFGAFTGKAALVMRRHGLPARTIHSLIYRPVPPSKEHAAKVKVAIDELDSDDKEELKNLQKELKDAEQMHFELNEESELGDAGLFVLDECSMVNDVMKDDILSFGCTLLVLGDPGQLPPISGTGALVRAKPNILLETIHRQALDNPIIKLSMKARTGQGIGYGEYGSSRKIKIADLAQHDVIECDQILTGKNITRRQLNQRMRATLNLSSRYPIPGDKLICLRNNAKLNIFNGLMCTVVKKGDEYDTFMDYTLLSEDGVEFDCPILRAYFDEYKYPGTLKEMKWWDFQDAEEFDYGYAITVHKSQGSQWDHVVFYDDGFLSWKQQERSRWLYTGITRAVERLTLVS